MDAVLKPCQAEQTVTPNKKQNRIKIPKKNMRNKYTSNPRDNFGTNAGLSNLPHSSSLFSSFFYQQRQQPPLLPLPTVSPIQRRPMQSPSTRSRRNRTIEASQSNPITTRDEFKKKASQSVTEFATPVVCTTSFWQTAMAGNGFGTEKRDSVFNLSPPPSSLPLPKFCVRKSKMDCNAEGGSR